MRQRFTRVLCYLSLALLATNAFAASKDLKEWSFLIYMNGDNSLDSYSTMNLKGMESVGSSDQVNIVVQWASMKAKTTKRLYITKSTSPKKVTSPVLSNMGLVDMGDYHSLIDFVEWGAKNYPAKHYFVAVWDHGGGWHLTSPMQPNDISWDDRTNHFISTQELGQSMNQISQDIGQKIDIYGSDACLMAMPEVATEMQASVNYFVGSEETEPGDGWPYASFLSTWTQNPTMAAVDVAKLLSHEYLKAYSSGGIYGTSNVTMSVMDMSQLPAFNDSIKAFGSALQQLSSSQMKQVLSTASATEQYAYADYKDVVDFTNRLSSAKVWSDNTVLTNVQKAVQALVLESDNSEAYQNSHGLSIWLPSSPDQYTSDNATKYSTLSFAKDTGWDNALKALNQ